MSKPFQLGSKFETVGDFWVPNNLAQRFSGELRREKNRIWLAASPIVEDIKIEDLREALSGDQDLSYEMLHGETKEGPCTLLNVQLVRNDGVTNISKMRAISAPRFVVTACIFGAHIQTTEDVGARSFSYGYSTLHRWIRAAPEVSRTEARYTISYANDRQPVFAISSTKLEADIKMEIVTNLSFKANGEYRSKNRVRLTVEAHKSRSLEWFLHLGNRMESFFSLLLGTSVALRHIYLKEGEQVASVVMRRRSKPEKFRMQVCVSPNLIPGVGEAARRWLETDPKFEAIENLIYGAIRNSSMYLETEFLSLCQALEAMHRLTDSSGIVRAEEFSPIRETLEKKIEECCSNEALAKNLHDSIQHANEPNLKTRVEALLERLPESNRKKLLGNVTDFEQTVRQTRNYFTHPGISAGSRVVTEANKLFLLNVKLHALLRWLMLIHTGFSADEVFEAIQQQVLQWR